MKAKDERQFGEAVISLRVTRSVETRSHAKRRNSCILHLAPIEEVMRSGCLRWFENVQRRDANNGTRRVIDLAIPDDEDVPRRRGTNRPWMT